MIQAASRKFDGSKCTHWGKLSVRSLYHGAVSLLDGDDMAWDGWHGKLARIAVLLFTMVSLASYTASLTAFFTQRLFTLVGPKTTMELAAQTTCVSNLALKGLAGEAIAANSIVAPYSTWAQEGVLGAWKWCAAKVESGEATSMYGPDGEFNDFLLNHDGCAKFGYSPKLVGLQTGTDALLIGNRSSASFEQALAKNLTIGISELKKDQDYFKLFLRWTHKGQRCANEDVDDQVEYHQYIMTA